VRLPDVKSGRPDCGSSQDVEKAAIIVGQPDRRNVEGSSQTLHVDSRTIPRPADVDPFLNLLRL